MEQPYICCFGEVLWDVLPSGRLPGGAPMNVATHLKNLNINSAVISRVGNDDLGAEIKKFLIENKCTTDWLQTDEVYPTGVVQVKLSKKMDATYTIVHPSAWDFISLSAELFNLVKNSSAFVFGTLACRDSKSYTTLFALLSTARFKVYDVNLRYPYFSEELVELLFQEADIVKMNDSELDIIASWYKVQLKDSEEKMIFLKDKFALQTVIVTKGEEGAMLLDNSGCYHHKGFSTVVADTIGCGDAFLAGFLKCRFENKSSAESLNFACALGALVASHSGANPHISLSDIVSLCKTKEI
jgi:fructokinase